MSIDGKSEIGKSNKIYAFDIEENKNIIDANNMNEEDEKNYNE